MAAPEGHAKNPSQGTLNYSEAIIYAANKAKRLRIIRFFPESDLRCGHDGLRQLARDNGVDPWELQPGEFLVFANRFGDKLKIYAPANVIVHIKSPNHQRIDLDMIRLIPKFFNGSEFDYPAALKEMLKQKLRYQ